MTRERDDRILWAQKTVCECNHWAGAHRDRETEWDCLGTCNAPEQDVDCDCTHFRDGTWRQTMRIEARNILNRLKRPLEFDDTKVWWDLYRTCKDIKNV